MKRATFKIEQMLDAMPECQAKREVLRVQKSIIRRAYEALCREGYTSFSIGYSWQDTHLGFDEAYAELAIVASKGAGKNYCEMHWGLI